MEDHLNQIGVLTRREIEARLAAPLIEALSAEFGEERVLEIVQQVIIKIAKEQGAQMAQAVGGCSLAHLSKALEPWRQGDAMEMEMLEQTEERLYFNARRCRYAEMYRDLGIPELGRVLSCSRDFALVEGFNPEIRLTRTQTLLEGAPYCDFRFDKAG